MAKLRHIAMVVEELEKTAKFYEKAFGMERVRQTDTAIGLSDGVVSLVIIHPSNVNMKGDDRRGLHHLGFLVDDVEKESARVEAVGAVRHGAIINAVVRQNEVAHPQKLPRPGLIRQAVWVCCGRAA
jgi:catechol 2,3-dioxygenase-like lactoylglutathione lyase family enzyme